MKMNLKTLGLGAVLTFTLITPAFADQNVKLIKTGDFQKPKIEKKVLSVEEQTKKLEQTLQKIEKAYKDGKMTEETYTAKKENIKKIMEDVKNGKKAYVHKKMTIEEKIQGHRSFLEKIEKYYEKGELSEEQYKQYKTKVEKGLEKLTNQ